MKLIDFIYAFINKCSYEEFLVECDNMDLPFAPRRSIDFLVNGCPGEEEKKWLTKDVIYLSPSLYSEKRTSSCEFVSRIIIHVN